MIDPTLVANFMDLFAGRPDVWGAVHGQCVREPVTRQLVAEHLYGKGSVGIYPLVDGMVHWGCTDIDQGYDLIALAANIWRVLRHLNISSFVEKSKGKGYHVWVLVQGWVEAEAMRNMLLFAHQVADVPPREINPKQVDGVELGNYVNLPYAKQHSVLGKRVVLEMRRADRCPLSLEEFMAKASSYLNAPHLIRCAAERYVPPPPKQIVQLSEYKGGLYALEKRMSGLTHVVFTNGPKAEEKVDRSFQIYRFACLCQKDGFTAGEALVLVTAFDEMWCQKFSERADGALQLQRVIERAFG